MSDKPSTSTACPPAPVLATRVGVMPSGESKGCGDTEEKAVGMLFSLYREASRNPFSSLSWKDCCTLEDPFVSDLEDTLKRLEQGSANFFDKNPDDKCVQLRRI